MAVEGSEAKLRVLVELQLLSFAPHSVQCECIITQELNHAVVLLIKHGHIDLLVAEQRKLDRLLEEASPSLVFDDRSLP